MKKEWFEPGPDGESPFVRKYNASPGTAGKAVAAAFRALLAGEEAIEPPALQVGDVVRLERYESNPYGLSWFESEAHLIGTEEKISGIYEDGTVWLSVNTCWPVSALTLIRRAGEAETDKPHDERDALINQLRTEVERLESEYQNKSEWCNRWQGVVAEERQKNALLTAEVERLQAQLLQVESFIRENDARPARISRLINQRQELSALNSKYVEAKHQRDAARAEVERLQGELKQCNRMNRDLTAERDQAVDELEFTRAFLDKAAAERDALRARIDAGVRAWEKWKQQCGSLWLLAFPGVTASQEWSDVCDALDADYVVYPIADADERTAGTIADRKEAS